MCFQVTRTGRPVDLKPETVAIPAPHRRRASSRSPDQRQVVIKGPRKGYVCCEARFACGGAHSSTGMASPARAGEEDWFATLQESVQAPADMPQVSADASAGEDELGPMPEKSRLKRGGRDGDAFGFNESFRPGGGKPSPGRDGDRFGFNESFRAGRSPKQGQQSTMPPSEPANSVQEEASAEGDEVKKTGNIRRNRLQTRTRYGFAHPDAVDVIPDGHLFGLQADHVIEAERVK